MGRQCGLSQFYQVCLCFLFNLLLSQMYDLTSMIFAVPLWGSEVANSKTEVHLTIYIAFKAHYGVKHWRACGIASWTGQTRERGTREGV